VLVAAAISVIDKLQCFLVARAQSSHGRALMEEILNNCVD